MLRNDWFSQGTNISAVRRRGSSSFLLARRPFARSPASGSRVNRGVQLLICTNTRNSSDDAGHNRYAAWYRIVNTCASTFKRISNDSCVSCHIKLISELSQLCEIKIFDDISRKRRHTFVSSGAPNLQVRLKFVQRVMGMRIQLVKQCCRKRNMEEMCLVIIRIDLTVSLSECWGRDSAMLFWSCIQHSIEAIPLPPYDTDSDRIWSLPGTIVVSSLQWRSVITVFKVLLSIPLWVSWGSRETFIWFWEILWRNNLVKALVNKMVKALINNMVKVGAFNLSSVSSNGLLVIQGIVILRYH